ncbi:hypothetical protein [Tissierella praeacuta]|uniref:hypothetical protein n=1 Tax=Tissierella praeacuta TaxID=43131 RepID=UPI0028A77EAF|nr:hypothetical protein [Tissierella praeacuta]
MTKCFADDGTICTALKVKECRGCAFFKTTEQKIKDDERTKKRLDSLKDKTVNTYF